MASRIKKRCIDCVYLVPAGMYVAYNGRNGGVEFETIPGRFCCGPHDGNVVIDNMQPTKYYRNFWDKKCYCGYQYKGGRR
jgi:hypothetical protein